jgi:hypothetical protein
LEKAIIVFERDIKDWRKECRVQQSIKEEFQTLDKISWNIDAEYIAISYFLYL